MTFFSSHPHPQFDLAVCKPTHRAALPAPVENMSAPNLVEASDPPEPRRLETWKIAISVGAAIILAPVIALALLVALGILFPAIPILSALLVRFYLTQPKPTQSQGLRGPRRAAVDEARAFAFIFAGDSRSHSTRI
jgi:hypothetical protein